MRVRIALVVAALAVICGSLQAQGLSTIVGTVTDPSGAVVPSAKVTVTQTGTGTTRSVTTDSQGYFVVPALRPARYDVAVERPVSRSTRRTTSRCLPTRVSRSA